MSERPEISDEYERDYDLLLERMLPLTEKWLNEQDGFIPCGAVVTKDGEAVGKIVGADESTTTERAMHMLWTGFQADAKKGRIRATCACYDGTYSDDGMDVSAVVIILEHIRGPSTIIHRPYTKESDGSYSFGQLFGERVPSEVFAGL